MKTLLMIHATFFAMTLPCAAMSTLETSQLKQLDPMTRLEQRCDVEAMERIQKNEPHFSPDKVLAYAFSDPLIKAQSIDADGAALRSHERWYRLSYQCRTGDDQMTVTSFHYQIGAEVSEKDWAAHYLVP